MKTVTTILQLLFGLLFLVLGLSHFYYTSEMAIFVPLPSGARLFVYAAGIVFTLCAAAIILDRFVKEAAIIIACTLAISAGFVQLGIEWQQQDEILKTVGITNVIKLLVAVAILLAAGYYSTRKK